jgi:hypothetical protein
MAPLEDMVMLIENWKSIEATKLSRTLIPKGEIV